MEFNFKIPINANNHRILIIDIIHNLEPLPIYEFNDDDEFINVKLIFKNEHYKNTFLDKLTDNKIYFGDRF
jgi:hypothetical protein